MLESILVPIFICVVLPVAIIWIVGRTKQNETNRKSEIMLKALESGVQIDPEMFKSAEKAPKTIKQDLLEKLTGACITGIMGIAFLALNFLGKINPSFRVMFSNWLPLAGGIMLAVGIGLLVSYLVGRKILAKEIEAEEEALKK